MTTRSRFTLPQLGMALLLFGLFAAARPATAQTTDWTTLERDDLHFSILMPGDELPPEIALRVADPQFSSIHNWPSAATQETVRFVAYDLEDDDSSDATLQAIVHRRLLDAAAQATGERAYVDAERPVTLQGFSGLEVSYHDSQWQYRSRIFVVRRYDKVFTTTVTTYPDRPFSADAAKFEQSLQVVSPATTTASVQ
jgi:hypothetical protein